jgi:hypothetical protein
MRFLLSGFSHGSVSPGPLDIFLASLNYFENSRRYSQLCFYRYGVNDTVNKLFNRFNNIACVVDAGYETVATICINWSTPQSEHYVKNHYLTVNNNLISCQQNMKKLPLKIFLFFRRYC